MNAVKTEKESNVKEGGGFVSALHYSSVEWICVAIAFFYFETGAYAR